MVAERVFFLLAFSSYALRNEEWLIGCHGPALFAGHIALFSRSRIKWEAGRPQVHRTDAPFFPSVDNSTDLYPLRESTFARYFEEIEKWKNTLDIKDRFRANSFTVNG